jgi:hypothetical protein
LQLEEEGRNSRSKAAANGEERRSRSIQKARGARKKAGGAGREHEF